MSKFRLAVVMAVLALVAALFSVGSMASAQASGDDAPCVPSDAWTETIHHDAITHVVHHDAVTHIVHHDAVPATADLWWNWSPNDSQGPQDYEPAFPVDERGTWQGPHENGGPDQDTFGTFNVSNGESGNSSWFHREHGTPGVDAFDETVVDTEAYDETVVDQVAYDETVVHPAVTCPTDNPPVDEPPVNTPPVSPPVVVVHNTPTPKNPSVPTVVDAGL